MDAVRDKAIKMQDELRKNIDLANLEEIIKDNKVLFTYKGKEYRIRLLNLKEKQELLKFQTKKENEMREEGIFRYERVLIPELKKTGIDISAIDKDCERLRKEEEKIALQLGESIKKQEPLSVLETYHNEIETIQKERQQKVIEKSLHLSTSLENQLLNATITYVVYLSLEVKVEETYLKAYSSYDEMLQNMDESLLKQAVGYSTLLQYETE